ncbi:response regulator transcription factor [Paracoccus albus]|uniref:response regulator transcription factor n=1 Tax=Paracoccus albus TaxID=3017784 RepID=UPI0022F0BD16|nr:response regulator [Paracoccus albus]WBU60638.1 response regulator [Paracoccus albus]
MSSGIDILLIEDEPNIAEAIQFILSRDGWRVEHWSEGGDAMARIRQHLPRLIILDVMLPVRSGLEVLEDLRKVKKVSHTPVLLLTARGTGGNGGISAGSADRILSKPFDNAELRQVVHEILGAKG